MLLKTKQIKFRGELHMFQKNKKLAVFISLFLCMAMILTACTSKDKEETNLDKEVVVEDVEAVVVEEKTDSDKVRVGYLAIPGNVLYFIANDLGYFAEENIDAELSLFKSSSEGVAALMSDKIDVGTFGTTAELSLIANDADITVFGGQMSQGSGIVALADRVEEFRDFKDYKGKTLGLVRMSTGDVVFRKGLIDAGLEINKDVTIVELDSAATVIEAVKKGEVDAGGVWIPHIKNSELQGLKMAMLSGQVMEMHPCARQAAMTDNLVENQEVYERFNRAIIRAYKFYLKNQEETVDIMLNYIKIDRDILMSDSYDGNFSPNPNPGKEKTIEFWEAMKEIGYIESEVDFEKHVNEEIYINALNSILKENPDEAVYLELKSELSK